MPGHRHAENVDIAGLSCVAGRRGARSPTEQSATRCRSTRPVAHRQIEPSLIFPMPALQGIFGWVTQLTNGWPDAFAELDVELNRSNPVFVRIHELPPGSPSFRPHPLN